jgi:hypothetical protein
MYEFGLTWWSILLHWIGSMFFAKREREREGQLWRMSVYRYVPPICPTWKALKQYATRRLLSRWLLITYCHVDGHVFIREKYHISVMTIFHLIFWGYSPSLSSYMFCSLKLYIKLTFMYVQIKIEVCKKQ